MSASASATNNVNFAVGSAVNGMDVEIKVYGARVEMKFNSSKSEVPVIGTKIQAYVGLFKFKGNPSTKIEQAIMGIKMDQDSIAHRAFGVNQKTTMMLFG